MSKREAFLQATGKATVQDFLHFIQLHKNVTDPFDLEEILEEFPRKQKEELWQKLKTLLMETLVANPIESWHKIDEESDDDMEVEGASEIKCTMEVIHGVTIVATVSISAIDEDVSYKALLDCAALLNSILEALPRSESQVRLAILRLCEAWWKKNLEKKEQFGKTAFSLLLAKSLDAKPLVSDIGRLWHLHPCLLSFDYESEDSSELKELLLQCFMSHPHIKKEEGRRFLSFAFSWDVNFVKLIHRTIKNQLLSLPKSMMRQIADIYFRAWKNASGDILTAIEYTCMQDFMHHGVHLPRNSPVQPRVREILSYFHQQQLRQGVEEMMFRLYKPVIWRGLKAVNWEVRSNAALLFVEVFPLRDPDMNHEDMDSEIQKQFGELFDLLEDSHPVVRSTAILGVSKIAAKYWEMIPPTILTDLLKKILGELVADISSADVRGSVFKSLKILLDNKFSHPLLEQMLPSLRNSLHDNSEKVRVAFVDMLLKIKAVRVIKFWKLCPMEHLLARLECDSRPVCRRIVNLIFNSFFPVNQPEDDWCERCVALIQMNPGAARRFYQYAYEHTAPTNIAKLMLTIRRCLNSCLQKSLRSENEENEDDNGEEDRGNKTNKSVLENVLSKEDASSVASLLEIVAILWVSIRKALEQNEEAKLYTTSKFASVLPEYFRVFKDDRCTAPLIILASFMPPSAVPTFSCSVLSKLRNLDSGADESKYSSLIDCMCRWGQVGHLLDLIIDWLSESLPEKKKHSGSGRQVRIQDTRECKPDLALEYIEYIMSQNMNRDCLLAAQTNKLNDLLKQLGLFKEVLCSFLKAPGVSHSLSQETCLRAFSLYCRLNIHLQYKFSSEGRLYLSVLEDTGGWIEGQILKDLSPEALTEEQIKLAQEILQTYLTVCKDVIMVGLGDSDFQAQLLQVLLAVMQPEKCCDCLPVLLSLLKEITESCLPQKMNDSSIDLNRHLDAVQTVFHKAIEISARRLKKEHDKTLQLLQDLQVPVAEFVCTVQCWHMASSEVHRGVLSTILAAVVVEISHALRKISNPDEIYVPTSVSELPPLSKCLMSVIVKTTTVLRSFLGVLAECVSMEEIEGILSLTATLYIIMVSCKGKQISAAAKDILSTVYRKLKNHREVTMEDDDNIERAIYESSMRTLAELLQP
ncbi:condensin-2 complex subunit G2 [Hyperolius riggenbachi]|uniref:condensin-2 complex subunit G2 n=1 Tax=Hyperolius riggenbachi TaxID=752182 RepID=UPI0035A30310